MDSEATLIVSPIRSNPPCTISNLLCPPLVRLSRKVIKVTNSRLGTDNEETIHTLLGSIILPTDRKMYEKETTAELNHLSKVLTYEFIILKEMRHLKIVGASTMLGKQDEDINKLNKQVENFMVSKKGLEKEVTSLRSQVGELTSSLQREKRDQADKALLIHVKISQLKEVLQKTRVESKANFD